MPRFRLQVAEATEPVPRTQGRRVLIIEDCEDTANSLREVLELEGYRAEEALTGPEGLEKARRFRPEVVLCDLGLPGMDGFAVARAFLADRELVGCVLIAFSGYAQPDDVRRAIAAGFRCHIAKPTDVEVLCRMLAAIPHKVRDLSNSREPAVGSCTK